MSASRTDRPLAIKVALVYAAICVVNGAALAYLPIWFDWRGLSAAEIATVSSAPIVFRIAATPIAGYVADRFEAHRTVLVVAAACALAALLALTSATTFWPILLLHGAFAIAWSLGMPLTETVAMAGARRGALDYGRVRVWGSIAFIATTLLAGVFVTAKGPPAALAVMMAGAAATIVATFLLPQTPKGGTQAARAPVRLATAIALARHPVLLMFLLATGAVQSAHAAMYMFGSLHWQKSGISAAWCGGLWSIAVLAEILVFMCAATIARFMSGLGLVVFGSAVSVLRWIILGFDPPFAALLALQILHGITYGASHLGAMQFLARAVPEGSGGTAQALYATVAGALAMSLAMQVAGQVYVVHAGRAYWAMAVIALIALAATLALQRMWRGETLVLAGERAMPSS